MNFNNILIPGCPLCDIFLNPKENIKTKLHYQDNSKISESDFVILDCRSCKIPMVVVRDHVEEIQKELWGRILRECRYQFGYSSRLRCAPRTIKDHYHCHLIVKRNY